MSVKINPTYNKVFVKIDPENEKTKSGLLYIPEQAVEARKNWRGVVVTVGPGRITENGTLIPPCVKAGDKVMVTAYSGAPIFIDEVLYTVLPDQDVICVIEEDADKEFKIV